MATSSTTWAWQKLARATMPSAVLGKEPVAPSRPMRAASEAEEISTPQIMRVTVTCLVDAMGSHATVRSCVTRAAVPVLSDGDKYHRMNGSRPPAGDRVYSVPHCDSFLHHCRLFRDTRMTRFCGFRKKTGNGKSRSLRDDNKKTSN